MRQEKKFSQPKGKKVRHFRLRRPMLGIQSTVCQSELFLSMVSLKCKHTVSKKEQSMNSELECIYSHGGTFLKKIRSPPQKKP